MAEPFGDFVNAVPGVEQIRRDQMPDLMGAERPDPGRDSDLVEPAGNVIRPQVPTRSTGEQVPRRSPRLRRLPQSDP